MSKSSTSALNEKLLQAAIVFCLMINAYGLFSVVLGSNDANFYSVIAKHIFISNDWLNLTFANQAWLDKPHLPFWLTALSYKIFGINTFAYIFPGFIFNLLGARYTYLLARHLYNKKTALLAVVIYLSTLHLMLSSIDVRAEAYLMGEIMPACYYWLLYHETTLMQQRMANAANANAASGKHGWELIQKLLQRMMGMNYLFKGAFFTALAIMTKGIFVLITIFSSIAGLSFYQAWRQGSVWHNLISRKWVNAVVLSLLFSLPELIALFIQFDLHPELVVFGHTHVSGLKFFFWDSQFGRFFNTGPITIKQSGLSLLHYVFFVHTLLWAFLPWSIIFIVALFVALMRPKWQAVYLICGFLPTFILFSLSKFQLDYYINIIFPFAAIICADYLLMHAMRNSLLFKIQIILLWLLWFIAMVLSYFACNGVACIVSIAIGLIFGLRLLLSQRMKFIYLADIVVSNSVLVMGFIFIVLMVINNYVYSQYDAGYNLSKYLNTHIKYPLIDYQMNSTSLEFHSHDTYTRVDSLAKLQQLNAPYYLVIRQNLWAQVKVHLPSNIQIVERVPYIPQQEFIPLLLHNIFKHSSSSLAQQSIIMVLVTTTNPLNEAL